MILVLGSQGMLGSQVMLTGKELGLNMTGYNHDEFDLTSYKISQLEKAEIIINCAGLVRDRGFSEYDYCNVNGMAVRKLAFDCKQMGIKLVQISTDCVFKGDGPKNEYDRPDAKDVYGISKIMGEVAFDGHLTVRCSFVGIGQRGLLNWFFKQDKIEGYKNVQWNGLTSITAAKSIIELSLMEIEGIVHLYGEDTNKYLVLKTANECFNLGKDIIPVNKPIKDHRLRSVRNINLNIPPFRIQMEELANAYSGYSGWSGQGIPEISSGVS